MFKPLSLFAAMVCSAGLYSAAIAQSQSGGGGGDPFPTPFPNIEGELIAWPEENLPNCAAQGPGIPHPCAEGGEWGVRSMIRNFWEPPVVNVTRRDLLDDPGITTPYEFEYRPCGKLPELWCANPASLVRGPIDISETWTSEGKIEIMVEASVEHETAGAVNVGLKRLIELEVGGGWTIGVSTAWTFTGTKSYSKTISHQFVVPICSRIDETRRKAWTRAIASRRGGTLIEFVATCGNTTFSSRVLCDTKLAAGAGKEYVAAASTLSIVELCHCYCETTTN